EIVERCEPDASTVDHREVLAVAVGVAGDDVERLPLDQSRNCQDGILDRVAHELDRARERRAAVLLVLLYRQQAEGLTEILLMHSLDARSNAPPIVALDEQARRIGSRHDL